MFLLTAKTKQKGPHTFETTEPYFDTGLKAFGVILLFLAWYSWYFFDASPYFYGVLILLSFILLGLQSVYLINLENKYSQNYWQIMMIRWKRGAITNLNEFKGLIAIKEQKVSNRVGLLQIGGGSQIASSVKTPTNYEIHIQSTQRKKIFIGEFSNESDAAQVLDTVSKTLNLNCYSVKIDTARELNTKLLPQGRIKLLRAVQKNKNSLKKHK